MKKLTSKEKNLIIFLAFAFILAIFYNLFVYSMTSKYREANLNLDVAKNNLEVVKATQLINNSEDTSVSIGYKEIEQTLKKLAKDYSIDSFMQEQIIINLNDFAVTNYEVEENAFRITKADFYIEKKYKGNDNKVEEYNNSGQDDEENYNEVTSTADNNNEESYKDEKIYIEYLNADIEYYSSYEALVNYLKNIERYSEAVILKNITLEPIIINRPLITGDEPENDLPKVLSNGYVVDLPTDYIISNGIVRGKMELQFVNIPIINDYVYSSDSESILAALPQGEGNVVNPFNPYTDFSNRQYEEESPTDEDIMVSNEPVYTTIYDFEEFDYFFVGKPTNVKGGVELSDLSYSGNFSAKLGYEFVKGVEESSANLVFTNTIVLNRAAENIGLEIYDFGDNPYILGIVLRDSGGIEHEVDFGAYIEGLAGWKKYYSSVPPEVNYPCVVSRVYMRTVNEKTKLSGQILMDKLQVSYQ